MAVAHSRGLDIGFEDAGAGFPVVLVNGFGGSAAEWREVGYVDKLVAHPYRVLSVDPLGHGRSAAPHDWELYRAPAVALDLVAAMDAAGVDRVALWGYSRGAWLASIIAVEQPDRVAALVLGGAHSLLAAPDPTVEPWVEALLRGDWAAVWEQDPDVSEYDRRQTEMNDPRALGAAQVGRGRGDYVLDVAGVTAPALVYCGGGDDPEACEPVAAAFGVPLQTVGTGDHFETFLDVDGAVALALRHLASIGA